MNDIDNDKDADYEEGSFVDRVKESPRTVSALIIILIVAAAIYAFSGNQTQQQDGGQTDQGAAQDEGDQANEGDNDDEASEGDVATASSTPAPTSATTTPMSTPLTQEQIKQAAENLPEPRKTGEAYVEVAQAGDGVTHLSRRAVTRWLSENQASYQVTNEHRIYIEDYIQNRLGNEGLTLGAEKTVSFEMVREAVEAAKSLNEQQLRNLSQYTHALT